MSIILGGMGIFLKGAKRAIKFSLGRLYRLKWWLFAALRLGPRVQGGAKLQIGCRVRLRGPGTVVFDESVNLESGVDLYTHSREAVIHVGSGTYLNGTRIGCALSVTIGVECIVADARIMDTNFHSVARNRRAPGALVATAPVHIGDNVWLAAGVGVLPGVRIGRDSVVGFASVVTRDIPEGRLFSGNPAVDRGPVPES